ncbi:MAG: hypothetical protein HY288_02580 [Planctomycetia bacterium]|nr:hypothetical protein [Planctomycetia bacterium]
MPAELSPELRQALTATPDGPLEVIDPVTKKAYVLVSADAYQRVQALLGEEGDVVRDMSGLLVDLSPEDWEDAANYNLPKP